MYEHQVTNVILSTKDNGHFYVIMLSLIMFSFLFLIAIPTVDGLIVAAPKKTNMPVVEVRDHHTLSSGGQCGVMVMASQCGFHARYGK
jgi:hypothetical protein